jgi:hypothetical protein
MVVVWYLNTYWKNSYRSNKINPNRFDLGFLDPFFFFILWVDALACGCSKGVNKVFLCLNDLKIMFFWPRESLPWLSGHDHGGKKLDLQEMCHQCIFY